MSTSIGRALIQVLPEIATRPDMTALWEVAMRRLADGQMPLDRFLAGVVDQLRKLVEAGRARGALAGAASLIRRRLVKRPAQRAMVLKALDEVKQAADKVKISLVDKQFALVAKVVDLVVENAMRETGEDIYERGLNIALANVLRICVPVFGGPQFLPDLLDRFQRMMRERTPTAYDTFFRPLFETEHPPQLDDLLGFVRAGHVVVGPSLVTDAPKGALDISMTSAFAVLHQWRHATKRELVLYHDRSSNMQKNGALWEAIVSADIPDQTVGYDRRSITFPIGVTETKFEDSKAWAGLQLADVIAGAIFYWARWRRLGFDAQDEYGVALENRLQDWQFAHIIQPTKDVSPEELGTDGPIALPDPNELIGRLWSEKGLI